MFQVVYKEMGHIGLWGQAHPQLFLVFLPVFPCKLVAVGQVPGVHVHGRVAGNVFHGPAPFQDQGPEPVFTKLLGCPATADSRAYNYGIENF